MESTCKLPSLLPLFTQGGSFYTSWSWTSSTPLLGLLFDTGNNHPASSTPSYLEHMPKCTVHQTNTQKPNTQTALACLPFLGGPVTSHFKFTSRNHSPLNFNMLQIKHLLRFRTFIYKGSLGSNSSRRRSRLTFRETWQLCWWLKSWWWAIKDFLTHCYVTITSYVQRVSGHTVLKSRFALEDD